MHRGPVAEIDCSALQHNFRTVRTIAGERQVIAVIKADAYGHGAVETARALTDAGADMLAVAFVSEARHLREAGIGARILVLFDTTDIPALFDLKLTPVLHDTAAAAACSREAARRGTTVPVHVKIDTGMGRLGIRPDSALTALCEIAGMKGVVIEGVMSHFSEADLSERSYADHQLTLFRAICSEFTGRTGRTPVCHMANSAAVFSLPDALLDAVRPGIALYGYSLFEKDYGLLPAMQVRAKIVAVRSVPAGTPVSYGRTFVTKRESRIAVVGIGYADGYSRLHSNTAGMLVNGFYAPVAGRVCMDLTMLDVTDAESVSPGDEAVVLGTQAGRSITAVQLAQSSGTIPYEILTSLGSRARRAYLK